MQTLPAELTSLVNEVTRMWGETIREESGSTLFKKVEKIRVGLKKFRGARTEKSKTILLEGLYKKLALLSNSELQDVAHSFAVLLLLINACENSVRSLRIRQKQLVNKKSVAQKVVPQDIYLVLTAHPTESRSPEILKTMQQIQILILAAITERPLSKSDKIRPLMRQLWSLHLARSERPEVKDEAEFIYSNLFRPEIIAVLLEAPDRAVHIRTWVGGDKDGHPGVNASVTQESLQLSRRYTIKHLKSLLEIAEQELALSLNHTRHLGAKTLLVHQKGVLKLKSKLIVLSQLSKGDGNRVLQFKTAFSEWVNALPPALRRSLYSVARIQKLLIVFPALVVPLELRESSDILRAGVEKPHGLLIFKMLQLIKDLCGKLDPQAYASGFIISMTETLEDMQIAETIIQKVFKTHRAIPVVPLFEKVEDLRSGPRIVEEWLQLHQLKKFEIMLGYSDSSKGAGVLTSRLQIRQAIFEFEKITKKFKDVQLTYFHGSGGSIDRGGGRLEDQCAHWPTSALERYKVTIQGEMIPRTFSTPEILRQYLNKIHDLQLKSKNNKKFVADEILTIFSDKISSFYKHSIENADFLQMVEKGSAYRFLEKLYFGSRPTNRRKLDGIDSLRAIPWILGWTQTRILLPVWWGFGTAFSQMNRTEKNHLAQLANGKDPLFTSYIHQMNFTLAKIESSVWFLYLQKSKLSAHDKKKFIELFRDELKATQKALKLITRHAKETKLAPWLLDSICLRSPLIHPLNIAQLLAWDRQQYTLLRESAVGIACGMLTTG